MQRTTSYDSSDYDSYDEAIEGYRWKKQTEVMKAKYRRKLEARRESKELMKRIQDYYDYEYEK